MAAVEEEEAVGAVEVEVEVVVVVVAVEEVVVAEAGDIRVSAIPSEAAAVDSVWEGTQPAVDCCGDVRRLERPALQLQLR